MAHNKNGSKGRRERGRAKIFLMLEHRCRGISDGTCLDASVDPAHYALTESARPVTSSRRAATGFLTVLGPRPRSGASSFTAGIRSFRRS